MLFLIKTWHKRYLFVKDELINTYRLLSLDYHLFDWLIQFRIDRLSVTVAFIALKPEDLAVKVCWSIEEYSILKPRCVKTQGKREFETIRLLAECCVVPLATTHGPHGLVIVSRLVTNLCWIRC